MGLGDAIVCLQEASKWPAGKVVDGYRILSSISEAGLAQGELGEDCAFMVPAKAGSSIRGTRFGKYWAGIFFDTCCILNIHVLHQALGEDAEHETLLDRIAAETQQFANYACHRTSKQLPIIIAMDANVTFPRNIPGFSGSSLLTPLPSHTPAKQRNVSSILQHLRVRALNTFSPNAHSESLWTCGIGRPLKQRSQIDYVCVDAMLDGVSYPLHDHRLSDLYARFRFDHRPVAAFIRTSTPVLPACPPPPTLKGWRPKTASAHLDFQRALVDCKADLSTLESQIKMVAQAADHETSKTCKDDKEKTLRSQIAKARDSLLTTTHSDEVRCIKKRIRNLRRKLARYKARLRLQSLRKRSPQTISTPVQFEINDRISTDAQEWLQELAKFGAVRFGCNANLKTQQTCRVEKYASAHFAQKLDGHPQRELKLFDFLQARAAMGLNKGVGVDGLPMEVYRALPWLTTLHIYHLFKQRLKLEPAGESPFWTILQFLGIPKCKNVKTFQDLRWICKAPVLEK